jgi:hypothetical protein
MELSGDVELTGKVFALADTTFSQQTTRARAFLTRELGASARLELGLDAYTFSGQTSVRLADLLPSDYASIVDSLTAAAGASEGFGFGAIGPSLMLMGLLGRSPNFDSLQLNRALLSWHGHGISVDAGRQPVSWGSGYAWNPTNVFSRKTLLEPTRQLSGIDVVRVRAGRDLRLEFLLQPDDTPRESGWAARLLTSSGGWDLSVMASRLEWRRVDWSAWLAGEEVSPTVEWDARYPYLTLFTNQVKRLTFGGDMRGEIGGVGMWCEAGWNHLDVGNSFLDLTTGVDHLFGSQTYLLVEYHREGEGRISADAYEITDWLKALSGERAGMGRHYLFGVANHPLSDLSELSLVSLWNLSDGSSVSEVTLSRSLADDLLLTLAVDLPLGGDGDELGRIGAGGFLRLTAYF